jgi:polar amino acid transport system substrate-binding protein
MQPVGEKGFMGRLALALAALALAAQPLLAGDLADVKARGKLVVVIFPNQDIPFVKVKLDALQEGKLKLTEMRNPDDFEGIDIALMKGFAKSLGVGLEVHTLTSGFGELVPALLRREGDIVANSLTITAKRREVVEFTAPYFEGAEAIVVRADSKIASAADLAGKKCVAARGTSQYEAMMKLFSGVQVTQVDFPFQAYVDVDEGKADCAIAETGVPVGKTLQSPYPPLKVAFVLRNFQYGMAVRKGSDLLAPLNAYLDGLKRSGELQKIADSYEVSSLGWIPAAAKP